MATRSALSRLSLITIRSMMSTRGATRYFSDGKGRVLSEEERAAENKMERERLEKLKRKQEKEKAEKEKQGADKGARKPDGGSSAPDNDDLAVVIGM
ncbi:hypothetical protein Peur_016970 [Populus x canadensis]